MSTDGLEVVVERWLPAPPELVWGYFTDAELWVRWQGTEARIDARPGGEIAIRMGGSAEAGARGSFVELERPRRLVFTWGWVEAPFGDLTPGSTIVEVELLPERGGTRLRLVHRGLPEGLEGVHEEGWRRYLERLEVASSGGEAGLDPSIGAAPRG